MGNERTLRQLTIATGPAAFATFAEFLAGLVKLSFWRANAFLEEGNTEQIEIARREFRVRTLPECFIAALHNHVLPLAQRDSSQRFRARLAQDEGVQTLTRDYKDQLQETFLQLSAEMPSLTDASASAAASMTSGGGGGGGGGGGSSLDCATALGWLEQCGVLGHSVVRPSYVTAESGGSKPVIAALSVEQATEAYVEAMPAISCLGPELLETDSAAAAQLTALRHFQEWLARTGEIKYGALTHLTLADRTAGILQNVFERRTTESVVQEAMTPAQSDRFVPADWPPPDEMPRSELSILIEAWAVMELGSLPGYPSWEQPVFELLAQCVAPLVGIFGYYARSSLNGSTPESMGYVELHGWNDFVIDCNAITKSFSGFRAAEVFMDAPKQRDGLCFPEFLQTLVLCAFQRANTGRLDLMKRSAPRLVAVENALHSFLNSNVLPLAKSRNLLEAHRTFQEDEELQRVLAESSEELFSFFLTTAPPLSPVGEESEAMSAQERAEAAIAQAEAAKAAGGEAEDGIDVEQFLSGMLDLGLMVDLELQLAVWETTITPVQPGEFGNFVNKGFRSSFLAADAKQAFLDTLLTDALVTSASLPTETGACMGKLPPSALLEAVVRCAMAKFSAVNVLTTAGKTASLIDCLLGRSDEQQAVANNVDAHAPPRFDAEVSRLEPLKLLTSRLACSSLAQLRLACSSPAPRLLLACASLAGRPRRALRQGRRRRPHAREQGVAWPVAADGPF